MNDAQIVKMFLERDEAAIRELENKYNGYCFKIAWNILNSREDAEECVNETWFHVWSCIPPKRPAFLQSFVGMITRGLAIDCLRKKYAAKRMDLHMADIEAETEKLNSITGKTLDCVMEEKEFYELLNRFLQSQSEEDRDIFLRRYWYMDRLEEIAKRHGKTVSSIKSNLYRSRKKLYRILAAEGRI
ncbi:MAG: sigma-70 family RNA polymerase sigma factor [Lachnospiraceae bacterium]|nr:sigma-70 family RNA polymerase sigma factor [Lachnospiraceae bacterium]